VSRLRVLTVIAILIGGCAAPGASPLPGTQAAPTPPATAASPSDPTVGPTAPEGTPVPQLGLLLGSVVRPTVDVLTVRRGPSVSTAKVAVVTPSNVLLIGHMQTFEADGYTWYEIAVVSTTGQLPPLPEIGPRKEPLLEGWVAVAKGDTPYVERLTPRCPKVADLWNIAAMFDGERLACFGNDTIELVAVVTCTGCFGEAPIQAEPFWLARPAVTTFGFLSVSPLSAGRVAILDGHAAPTGPAHPPDGTIVRLRGHFDDEHARDCTIAMPLPGDTSDDPVLVPIDQASAELYCRQRFVVESYEVLGMDPDAPPPQ
jgi:hypothetical protein